jgi:NhaA family Na+:H+ antiporter
MQKKDRYTFPIRVLKEFLQLESAGGIILIFMLATALVLANSPLADSYYKILSVKLHIGIENFQLSKPLLLWINDGLMSIFFLLLAMEIKREVMAGQLSTISQVVLPFVAAIGGIITPAVIFFMLNYQDPHALVGWAIPTATDIALALGVVSMLGSRVPMSLKMFLVVLAIVDDIVAIALIAIFYTHHLAFWSLAIAIIGLATLFIMNRFNITSLAAYILVGIVIWIAVLKSGVHATLAGVAIGFFIPFKIKNKEGKIPLQHLEHVLQPWVAYLILPIFVLANAGVQFNQMQLYHFSEPVTLGCALGLFLGKQLGIFLFSFITIKLGFAKLPTQSSWLQLWAIAMLAGIGFTMSLFVSGLAYGNTPYELVSRAGILIGSGLSAILGVIMFILHKPAQ